MRPPRHRFSNEVRTATRLMAAKMVREGTIARSPGELEAWIEAHPETKRPLEKGGYDSKFTAHDLLPLLEALLVQAGAPAPEPDPDPGRDWTVVWIVALVVAIAIGGVLAIVLIGGI